MALARRRNSHFPVTVQDAAAHSGSAARVLKMCAAKKPDPHMSFLVVDDDEAIRESLVAYLEEFGVDNVVQAVDGQQALRLLGQSSPDVLLLDLMMPNVDGFQVLQAIRTGKTPKPARIVVLSAHIARGAAAQIRELGADACVSKPFSERDLRAAIGLS